MGSQGNHRGLLLSIRVSVLYFGILFALSLFLGFMFPFRKLYVTAGALDLLLYVLVRRTPKEDGRRNLILVYAFLSMVLGFSVVLGTYSRRSELAVAYNMLVTSLPMLFLDRPARMSAFIAGFTAFFCGMSFLFDKPDVMPHDIGNAIIISTISIMVNTYMIHTKAQKLVYERALYHQSEWDVLTGLRNRNSYEKRLKELPEKIQTGLAVVYADANGLHELNNDHGHDAGDQDRNETNRKLHAAQEAIRAQGWEIAAGVAYSEKEGLDVNALIRMAEHRMYQQKKAYYSETGHDRREHLPGDGKAEQK